MAGDPSGSSILEELDSSTVLPLAGMTRIKDDALTQGSDQWDDVEPLASAWANYVGEPMRLKKLAAAFHRHGGTTIFPPVELVPAATATTTTASSASSASGASSHNKSGARPHFAERARSGSGTPSAAAAAPLPPSADTPVDEDATGSEDTFRVLVQPGDFCLPVCEDGTAESQVRLCCFSDLFIIYCVY